jgi:hypothetical protein
VVRPHRIDRNVPDRRNRRARPAAGSDDFLSSPPDRARRSRSQEILLRGILDRAFPAAAVEVGRADGHVWQRAFGTLHLIRFPARAIDTVFDLASLTEVIATRRWRYERSTMAC